MEQDDKVLFLEYARLKQEKSAIDERLEELNPILLEKLMAIDGFDTKIETGIGSFTVRKVSVWTFPQAITDAEDAIKVAKETAKKVGDATCVSTPSVNFRKKALPTV